MSPCVELRNTSSNLEPKWWPKNKTWRFDGVFVIFIFMSVDSQCLFTQAGCRGAYIEILSNKRGDILTVWNPTKWVETRVKLAESYRLVFTRDLVPIPCPFILFCSLSWRKQRGWASVLIKQPEIGNSTASFPLDYFMLLSTVCAVDLINLTNAVWST